MPIINSSLFGSAGQIDNTRIARRLKNNEIIFDGETFSIKDILCNALVGTYSFLYNNSRRTFYIANVVDKDNPRFRDSNIIMTGYEIQPTDVTGSTKGNIINGVNYFESFTFGSPINVNGYFNDDDYSNLYAIGIVQK